MKYELPCAGCNEMVRVSRSRYLALVRAGRKPVCRENGCHRLIQFASGWVAAETRPSLADVTRTGVATIYGEVDRAEIGGRRATLAKARVKRGAGSGCDGGGAVDE